jgi:membrane-bound lytic murein transglycosylase A
MIHSPRKLFVKTLLSLTIFFVFGCHAVIKEEVAGPEKTMKPVHFFYPEFKDDLDFDSLILAIERNIGYLKRLDAEKEFQYGPDRFTCWQLIESQEAFLRFISERPGPSRLNRELKKRFTIYKAAGRRGNHKVLFTGYYEPIFEANLTRDEAYKYPLYRKPKDLVSIDLSPFGEKYKGQRIIARFAGNRIVPYYSRSEIDKDKVLKDRGLELAWLKDPVDVALLQIQGSGRLRLSEDLSLPVGYEASNGRPYRSIAKYMLDKGFLTQEQMSMQAIRRYLADHPERTDEILNQNPSYVFFDVHQNGPLGNINVPLTAGRSLALDANLFPKGALAFIRCRKPVVNERGEITEWIDFSRFVLNQDTGGAIKGAGRADLFWGNGPYAEMAAGHLKHDGELYFLVKKSD